MSRKKEEVKILEQMWTFTVIAAVFTVIILVLEALGYLEEFGMVLGGLGFLASLLLGLQAVTGTALSSTTEIIREEHKEISGNLKEQTGILREHTEILKRNAKLLEEIRDFLKKKS